MSLPSLVIKLMCLSQDEEDEDEGRQDPIYIYNIRIHTPIYASPIE